MIKDRVKEMILESDKRQAVGILVLCEDTDKVLLLKRNCEPHKGKWSALSGGIDKGESKLAALKREIMEEIKVDADDKIDIKYRYSQDMGDKIFHYYDGFTNNEFKCKLDDENSDYGWFGVDELPSPLYPKTKSKIEELCQKNKK